jgi:hypothetical protein
VALRFVPELHHGPVTRRYDAMPASSSGGFNAMPFALKDGQQEETLRELAAALTLQPGQFAVVGCDPDRRNTLGSFLFTQPEANSDRLSQKVLLIWAERSNPGAPGSQLSPSKLIPVEPPDLRPGHENAGPPRHDDQGEGPSKTDTASAQSGKPSLKSRISAN